MITLRHLKKEYPKVVPLKDVNAVINDGDIISVIGPSGTGKSTLLRCINLLERPTSGDILVNGQNITQKGCPINEVRKKMGMVFQSFNLFGHMTVLENVMMPQIDLLKADRQTAYDRAISLLHQVGMESRAADYPDMLSGGQQQRVAIARTLSTDPDIILFDEPTSALDPTMVGEVETVIRDLSRTGKTMVIVTHEMKFAREISNRVFYMDQGGIYEDGTPEQIFDHPSRELTRRFIHQLKICEITVDSAAFDFIGAAAALTQYGHRNLIPDRTVYHIQSVFEELCQQILLPVLDNPKICFKVEYDEKNESVSVTTLYNGLSFDPAQTDNLLSLRILQNAVEDWAYTDRPFGGYANQLTFRIK